MKKYLADTNFYLRFILLDNKNQAQKVKKYLERAKAGEIKIFFPDEVILEMEFVLRSFYSFDKKDLYQSLFSLVSTKYLNFHNRSIWVMALEIYNEKNISLLDILLFLKANYMGSEILSFDKDFKKLNRMIKL